MALKLRSLPKVEIAEAKVAQSVITGEVIASSFILQADPGNKGYIAFGDENVTLDAVVIGPGETVEYTGDQRRSGTDEWHLSDLQVIGERAGDEVRVQAVTRRRGSD